VLHPRTDFRRRQKEGAFIVTHGGAVRVFDENGKDYIEAMVGLWCAPPTAALYLT
jgi:4-aminobutyrate--pyruvate transaminase